MDDQEFMLLELQELERAQDRVHVVKEVRYQDDQASLLAGVRNGLKAAREVRPSLRLARAKLVDDDVQMRESFFSWNFKLCFKFQILK